MNGAKYSKLGCVMLAACSALLLLSSCGKKAEPLNAELDRLLKAAPAEEGAGSKKVLHLWSFHQALEYEFWRSLAKEYEKTHPDIEIKVDFVSSDDYFNSNRFLSSFASGQGPDLFFVSPATIKRFADANILYPLTDEFTPEIRSDFYPAALESVTVGNQIYAVPIETELLGLFYNKEMFRKAQLQPPKTWEEMRNAARRLKTSSVSGLTIETYKGVFQNFAWLPFLWQTGGDLVKDNGRTVGLMDGKSIQMFTFFKSMADQGLLNMRPSRPTTDIGILASGETAMQVSGTWNLKLLETEFANEPIGVVPLPVPEGGTSLTIAGGWKMAVNRQSSHALEAKKFIMWAFASDTSIPLRWSKDTKFAYPPRKSVMEAGEDNYRQGLRDVFTKQIFGTEREEPQLPEGISSIFSDSLQQLLFQNLSPEDIVKQTNQRIDNYLNSSNSSVSSVSSISSGSTSVTAPIPVSK